MLLEAIPETGDPETAARHEDQTTSGLHTQRSNLLLFKIIIIGDKKSFEGFVIMMA